MDILILKNLAIKVLEKKSSINSLGLINGQMGLCINIYELARITGDKELFVLADQLIEDIFSSLRINTPINFVDGISGIVWGIEYLTDNRFLKSLPDNIIEEFDGKILTKDIHQLANREDVLAGLVGYGNYLLKRLESQRSLEDSLAILIVKQATIDLIDYLPRLNSYMMIEPVDFTPYWSIVLLGRLLHRLYLQNLYNSKLDLIIEHYLKIVFSITIKNKTLRLLLAVELNGLMTLPNFRVKINDLYLNFSERIFRKDLIEETTLNHNPRMVVELCKSYSHLIKLNPSNYLNIELDFWKEKANFYLKKYIEKNEYSAEIIAKNIGFLDGFNGLNSLLPALYTKSNTHTYTGH